MDKLAIILAGGALVIACAAFVRTETEIRLNLEIRDLLQQLDAEIQFAKIVDHYNGEE